MSTSAMKAQPLERQAATSREAAVQLSGMSNLGSTVEAEDLATGKRLTYRLVEGHDAAPSDGLLSIDSPVGLVLRSRRAGEVVTATTPRGHRRLRILSVS